MTGLQAAAAVYAVGGIPLSVLFVARARACVERPAGGLLRFVAVVLLAIPAWLPFLLMLGVQRLLEDLERAGGSD